MRSVEEYSDIINLPRPVSKYRLPMERINRAAQFAPFAALTGYGEAINETGRLVTEKISLSEEEKNIISEKLRFISENLKNQISVTVVYFLPDKRKNGGAYKSFTGVVKRVNPDEDVITFTDLTTLKISDIKSISAPELDFIDDISY